MQNLKSFLMITNSVCIVEIWQSEMVFCRKKGHIGFELPKSCVTNRDKPWRTVTRDKNLYLNLEHCRKMPWQTVTQRDMVSSYAPKFCRKLSEINRKKTVGNACKNHGQTVNSMVGRSESVHTQMHANSPYFGSSGNEQLDSSQGFVDNRLEQTHSSLEMWMIS